MTLRQKIYTLIRNSNGWVTSYEIEDFGKFEGYMGSTATREARRLAKTGVIIADRSGKIVRYRLNTAPLSDETNNRVLTMLEAQKKRLEAEEKEKENQPAKLFTET